MKTLNVFSEKEREYFQYQARQEYLRVQASLKKGQELAEQQRLVAKQQRLEEEKKRLAAEKREQQALTEIERLKALLNSIQGETNS